MNSKEVRNRIETLRQRYIEPASSTDSRKEYKKEALKMKHKLVHLEFARCQALVKHQDTTAIEAEIAREKAEFQALVRKD